MQKSHNVRVLIDVRLANHAGIGRYSSQLVSALTETNQTYDYSILGPTNPKNLAFGLSSNLKVTKAFSDRYTLSEIFELESRCHFPKHNLFHTTNYILPSSAIPSITTIHDVMRLRMPEYCHSNTEFIRRFGFQRFFNIVLLALLQIRGLNSRNNLFQICKSESLTDTNHNSLFKTPISTFKFHHLYLMEMHNKAITTSRAIVTPSFFSKQEIINIFGTNVDRKIHVVYPGLSNSFCKVNDKWKIEEVILKYGLPKDFFIHVGLKRRHKNMHMLVDAYSNMLENIHTNHLPALVLVGPIDEDAKQLRAYAKLKGISTNLFFLGEVNDDDLNFLYNGSIALLFPSLYEGFGFPIIEAMACGTPVIASNGSSIAEISNNSAILLDPTQKEDWTRMSLKLYFDHSLRKKLEKMGLENAKKFNWSETASKIFSIYENVLNGEI